MIKNMKKKMTDEFKLVSINFSFDLCNHIYFRWKHKIKNDISIAMVFEKEDKRVSVRFLLYGENESRIFSLYDTDEKLVENVFNSGIVCDGRIDKFIEDFVNKVLVTTKFLKKETLVENIREMLMLSLFCWSKWEKALTA